MIQVPQAGITISGPKSEVGEQSAAVPFDQARGGAAVGGGGLGVPPTRPGRQLHARGERSGTRAVSLRHSWVAAPSGPRGSDFCRHPSADRGHTLDQPQPDSTESGRTTRHPDDTFNPNQSSISKERSERFGIRKPVTGSRDRPQLQRSFPPSSEIRLRSVSRCSSLAVPTGRDPGSHDGKL